MPSRSDRSSQRDRLATAACAGERPRERVVAVDRRAGGPCAPGELDRPGRQRSRCRRGYTAVSRSTCTPFAASRPVDHRDGGSLSAAARPAARALEQVAEQRDCLCGGSRLGGAPGLLGSRRRDRRRRRRPERARRARSDTREARGAQPSRAGERCPASRVPSSSLASSTCAHAVGSGCPAADVECELHRGESPTPVAHELAGVRDASVRGEARTERDHPVECGERLVVASELHEGVPDDAVRAVRARQQSFRTAAVSQRLAELVTNERERAETEHGFASSVPKRIARRSASSDRGRYDGVRGLAPAQLVGEPELGERAGIAGFGPNTILERPRRRCPERGRRSRRVRGRRAPRERRRLRGAVRLGQDTADEPAESERGRNRAAHDE